MQVTVLSPHRDDAAFSCGLTLHTLLELGSSLTIVNVCTVSSYAPYLVRRSGDLTRQTTELRRREDATFVERLRATAAVESSAIRLVDLEWQDMPLRWRMEDEQSLAPCDLPPQEVQELRNAFHALPFADIVLVPMAMGSHVDHRLVRQAAQHAFPASSLLFYEDLPYACRISDVARMSTEPSRDLPFCEVWLPAEGAARGLKREYALCYPSQIAIEVADEMETYAMKYGGRERFLACAEAMRTMQTALQFEVVL